MGATRGKAAWLCFLVTSENTTPATMDMDLDLESCRAKAMTVGEGGFNAAGRCYKHLYSSTPLYTDTAQDTLCQYIPACISCTHCMVSLILQMAYLCPSWKTSHFCMSYRHWQRPTPSADWQLSTSVTQHCWPLTD